MTSKKTSVPRKKSPPSLTITSHLKRIAQENSKLLLILQEATDKQHQEMTRAIQLKEKNIQLLKQLHDARRDACNLATTLQHLE